ncbi:hypothetical protein Btru_046690 [Bulinus truncatus]|nr:hypothetical protein Btru_046690 [Bulinus truncatus]
MVRSVLWWGVSYGQECLMVRCLMMGSVLWLGVSYDEECLMMRCLMMRSVLCQLVCHVISKWSLTPAPCNLCSNSIAPSLDKFGSWSTCVTCAVNSALVRVCIETMRQWEINHQAGRVDNEFTWATIQLNGESWTSLTDIACGRRCANVLDYRSYRAALDRHLYPTSAMDYCWIRL